MISASHNPYQDNGIKFFSNDGLKLPDDIEARIEELIVSNEIAHLRPTADAIGKAFRIDDAEGRYIEFVKRSLPRDLDFQGIKLVVDCANGAAYKVAPTVLRELGARVDVIGNKPDGMNINAGCGAVHPELLQRAVKEYGADLGIALDGDADRAIFICEQGNVIDRDLHGRDQRAKTLPSFPRRLAPSSVAKVDREGRAPNADYRHRSAHHRSHERDRHDERCRR